MGDYFIEFAPMFFLVTRLNMFCWADHANQCDYIVQTSFLSQKQNSHRGKNVYRSLVLVGYLFKDTASAPGLGSAVVLTIKLRVLCKRAH